MLSSFRPIDIGSSMQDTSARARGPVEARYRYADGEHDLWLRMGGVGERQVEAVRRGESEFALVESDPLILLTSRFGDAVPWSIASYCWHLIPREVRTLPTAPHSPEERRAFLAVALVEAESGAVRATRNVTLSLDFTRALHAAIRRQAESPWNPRDVERAQSDLDRRGTAVEAIVARASVRSLGHP